MKNALILHGAGNNSQGNWFPWLTKQLKRKSYKVWTPDLPDSDRPMLNKWLDAIFINEDWLFNNDSIIIGHSAGATLILRILEKLPKNTKIAKSILVAGPVEQGKLFPEYNIYKEDLVKVPFDWVKIKQSCSDFYFIYSDNDKYECGKDHGRKLQKMLGGDLIIKKGEGHFNLEKSVKYKSFPLLIRLIK